MTESLQQSLTDAIAATYRVEREIGRGGMARVYLAHDIRHDRPVAIKVLLPGMAPAISAERFEQEIRIVSRLTHPNIVGLIGSGMLAEVSGTPVPYYIMHFVDGESLRDRLVREGPLPVAVAVRIAGEVADALEFAHERGVVHRDIKPENILLQAGHAMVADFGVARLLATRESLESEGLLVGTPAYMSPEQWGGEATDGRTDVYSLACVLYEMLAGKPPFTGTTGGEVRGLHLTKAISSLRGTRPTVPAAIDLALARAMAKLPGDRTPSPAAFRAEIQAAVVPPPSPRRFGRGMLAGGLVAALLGAVYLGVTADDHDLLAVTVEATLTEASDRALTSQLVDGVSRSLAATRALTVFETGDPPVGSVVRIAATGPPDTVTVTARLIDRATDEVLANQSWRLREVTEDSRSAVALQMSAFLRRQIGKAVELRQAVRALRGREAREAVLQSEGHRHAGREAYMDQNFDLARFEFETADALLAEAARQDGRGALPWIQRGWISYDLSFFEDNNPALVTTRLLGGMAYADSALAREAGSPEALALRGSLAEHLGLMVPALFDRLAPQAEADLRSALEADQTLSAAHVHLSRLYRRQGRMAEAGTAALAAQSFDEFLLNGQGVASTLMVQFRELAVPGQARRLCEEGRLLYDQPDFDECRLTHFGYFGRTRAELDSAWAELRAIERPGRGAYPATAGFRRVMVAAVAARLGLRDSALAIVRQAKALTPESAEFYQTYILTILGERDEAIRILTPMVAQDSSLRSLLRTSYWFLSLRELPAFRQLAGQALTP